MTHLKWCWQLPHIDNTTIKNKNDKPHVKFWGGILNEPKVRN